MHVGTNFSAVEVIIWTRKDILYHFLIATSAVIIYKYLDCKWIAIPWLPIALLGTAVAFVVGFKNNASYDRLWEARRIWGNIINASRNFAILVNTYVQNSNQIELTAHELFKIKLTIINRHVAWLTALRYQLRERRNWETIYKPHNQEYKDKWFVIEEQNNKLEDALDQYLSTNEKKLFLNYSNKAVQILNYQSQEIDKISHQGLLEQFRHLEIVKLLTELINLQGACERIKNFPYPRQYATTNLWFVKIFAFLIPLGMLQEFSKLGEHFLWLLIPFSTLSAWIFTTLEKVGEASENPFEGSANDIPITSMCRTIEIDMLEVIGREHSLKPLQAQHDILT